MVIRSGRSLWAWLNRLLMLSFAGGLLLDMAQAQPGVSLYTIPVVFHVLHQNGTDNISDAQIESAITELNIDFDAPTVAIDAPFDTVVGDMDISFVLAGIAPDGSPTAGIDRIETPLTNGAGSDGSFLNPWPRNRYLNIWVVHSLDTAGPSYLSPNPALADLTPCTDGIMIYNDYLGTIGTGAWYAPNYLAAAVGRFFNLKRLNEDPINGGPCGDDEVADTPPCGQPTCLPGPNPCSPMPVNNRNFMYSPYGTNMFTLGQRERLHACLNSPVAQRDELGSGNYTTSPECTMSGIGSLDAIENLVISPMPFHDRITVTGLPSGNYHMQLMDPSGRMVATNITSAGRAIELNGDLASGTYVLTMSNAQRTIAKLVIKE